ncbi:VWA domain-containing protein [Gramella sp. GC03-9]|uniref:VWA domain-containing protein n=1 Tax=Christiangramia oceanisediminis TaxID=2920386 RepID=A0A9X2R922_9FLAO|nr:vWA domain-containing protein [Gramella oceanisediminis]MCP9200647.1 VWA domain-containing protein [Gramella oceanisediminis]
MTISTILLITLALFLALGFAFFLYLFRKPVKYRKDYILFVLRALGVFIVLLLLINPKITSTTYEIEKPDLVILQDNSGSISYLEEGETLNRISTQLVNHEQLKSTFDVSTATFGSQLSLGDSLDFSANQTNITKALVAANDIYSKSQTAVILLTDGNQSLGRDYRYFKPHDNLQVFPVVIGDTATYQDLSIERINTNRYAFLNNRFPVEVFLNYSGKQDLETTFKITSGETVLYSEPVTFSSETKSKVIRTDLLAASIGVKTYQVEIQPVENEKNKINNLQNFAVEVVDERTSVLILSDMPHPDLGAVKKSIERNQQRTAEIKYLNEDIQINDYQLIILYQVNRRFNDVIESVLERNHNYLMITGLRTDWNYLNSLNPGFNRSNSSQPQEVFPVYNQKFSSFQFEDIGFDDFPPLLDKFGTIEVDKNQFNIMLYQEIQGVRTGEALMGVSKDSPKSGFLFGENIWRWRAKSFLDNGDFEEFDDFFGKLVQNLASNRRRERLSIENEKFYYENENVIITAQYFDENYQFDPGAILNIELINTETEEEVTSNLALKNNFYQFDAGGLPAGDYRFSISVENQNVAASGRFEVIDYNTEQQFVSANLPGLQAFVENNQTSLTFSGQTGELIQTLLQSDKYRPVQKSRQKTLPLIDWYYLLFLLIVILAAEWFYRKYLGLI